MKLSQRLKLICDLYQQEAVVWDLCCDHGLIGQELLRRHQGQIKELHFVDRVQSIINKLRSTYIPKGDTIFFHVKNMKNISINPQKKIS